MMVHYAGLQPGFEGRTRMLVVPQEHRRCDGVAKPLFTWWPSSPPPHITDEAMSEPGKPTEEVGSKLSSTCPVANVDPASSVNMAASGAKTAEHMAVVYSENIGSPAEVRAANSGDINVATQFLTPSKIYETRWYVPPPSLSLPLPLGSLALGPSIHPVLLQ